MHMVSNTARQVRTFLVLVSTTIALGTAQTWATDTIEVAQFSTMTAGTPLPAQWQPLTFKKIPQHTVYRLTKDGDTVVVQATSQDSASGLIRQIQIDPREYPIVRWRWKVANILTKGDVHSKAGDDYPARLYITFAYDASKLGFFEKAKYEAARLYYGEYPPTAAINYIWESKAPVGLIVPNPYTERLKMIVVESGAAKLGQWVEEGRNLYEDYQKAFGEEPPMISAVAIMTDTDNTDESATAFYGDIRFTRQSESH
ncbi:MAG: DUF3047 domain-containing protein [Candidatus Binatia bacterium]